MNTIADSRANRGHLSYQTGRSPGIFALSGFAAFVRGFAPDPFADSRRRDGQAPEISPKSPMTTSNKALHAATHQGSATAPVAAVASSKIMGSRTIDTMLTEAVQRAQAPRSATCSAAAGIKLVAIDALSKAEAAAARDALTTEVSGW